MLGRTQKLIAKKIASNNKKHFILNYGELFKQEQKFKVPIHLVSMSGKLYFLDQLYSILSFYYNVGKPISWHIYDDGTYTQNEISIFSVFDFVKVTKSILSNSALPLSFIEKYPFLKRLEYYANHPIDVTTIFCDSDILFYRGFNKYIDSLQHRNWFLPDEKSIYFDSEYLESSPYNMFGTNAGFLVMNKTPNWQIALDYISSRINNGLGIGYWSEQTSIHLMVKSDDSFYPLDSNNFVLNGKDSFKIDSLKIGETAIRHFVGPVRHKMWQYSWKKVLGI